MTVRVYTFSTENDHQGNYFAPNINETAALHQCVAGASTTDDLTAPRGGGNSTAAIRASSVLVDRHPYYYCSTPTSPLLQHTNQYVKPLFVQRLKLPRSTSIYGGMNKFSFVDWAEESRKQNNYSRFRVPAKKARTRRTRVAPLLLLGSHAQNVQHEGEDDDRVITLRLRS